MSSQPVATYLEPLVGWRCWRVLPMQTLAAGKRYRLCASGTYGMPKVWDPRVPVVAKCSSFESRHEAPHRDHECGLYAYASREEAEAKFAGLAVTNGRQGVSWAFGRVSLWGRVIECELGWRAQYAYPYEVTVFTDGRAPNALAEEYAIDVESRPRSDLRSLIAQHPAQGRPVVHTISGWWRKEWYEKSIPGVIDSTFLKPYHEDICRRLDTLTRSVAQLEKRDAALSRGGLDDG